MSEQLRVELYVKLLSFLVPCYRLQRIYEVKMHENLAIFANGISVYLMCGTKVRMEHDTSTFISLLSVFHQYPPDTVLFLHGLRVKSKL